MGQLSFFWEKDPEAWEKFIALVHYLMKWRKFTDSRWVTVGASSRLLLLSLSVGMEDLAQMTRVCPNVSDYHLHGFEKLTKPVAAYVVVAGLAAYPVEAFSLELLEDDRMRRAPREFQDVARARSSTWKGFRRPHGPRWPCSFLLRHSVAMT